MFWLTGRDERRYPYLSLKLPEGKWRGRCHLLLPSNRRKDTKEQHKDMTWEVQTEQQEKRMFSEGG